MSTKRYISIDKTIFAPGCSYDFSIYGVNKSEAKKVKELKQRGVILDDDDLLFIKSSNAIYIDEVDKESYKEFYESFLYRSSSELNKRKDTVDSPKNPSTFTEKVEVMYQNASVALNDLFQNPETLNNYKESKKVVNDLVTSVLDDDFAIKSLMCIATHDYYTHTHSINVSIYALSLGTFLGMSKKELEELGEAALIHDLGKSKIDPEIINKKGFLTDDEFKEIKKHPTYGHSLAFKLGVKNKNILDGIKYHHEKMDGSGYPLGLSGDKIPLNARIVAICDIFDALTSQRSYKKALTSFEALKLMKTEMNKHLDVRLLNKMILMFR